MKSFGSPLIASVSGPFGDWWARKRKRDRATDWLPRHYLKKKSSDHCACKCFTLADQIYHDMPEAQKDAWRLAATRQARSGYDLFMKEAIWLFSRRRSAPMYPSSSGGWSPLLAQPFPLYLPPPCTDPLPDQDPHGSFAFRVVDRDNYYIYIDAALSLRHTGTPAPWPVAITRKWIFDINLKTWRLNDALTVNNDTTWTRFPIPCLPTANVQARGITTFKTGNLNQGLDMWTGEDITLPWTLPPNIRGGAWSAPSLLFSALIPHIAAPSTLPLKLQAQWAALPPIFDDPLARSPVKIFLWLWQGLEQRKPPATVELLIHTGHFGEPPEHTFAFARRMKQLGPFTAEFPTTDIIQDPIKLSVITADATYVLNLVYGGTSEVTANP